MGPFQPPPREKFFEKVALSKRRLSLETILPTRRHDARPLTVACTTAVTCC